MKFVLASHNKGKLAEMQRILGQLGVEVVLQSDLGLALEPEENGTTFAENAMIKAKAVMQAPVCRDRGRLGSVRRRTRRRAGDLLRALRRARRRQGALSAPAAESARGDDARGALPHVGRMLLPGRRCADGGGRVCGHMPMLRRAREASAMTRCSSYRSCERRLPSSRPRRKTRSPTAENACAPSRRN